MSERKIVPVASLIEHIRTPLYRNGYMLILSQVTTSALGIVFWVLATRYYPPEVVGLNSAMLSAMALLSSVSLLCLNSALVRFVPIAGPSTRRLVLLAYICSMAVAAILSLIFVFGIGLWIPALRFLGANSILIVSFMLATITWNIFTLQDSVLTGLRQTVWIPIENIIFAVVKIVLLGALAIFLPQYGIFAAWTIPVVISLLPVNGLIFWRLIPNHIQASDDQATPLVLRQVLKFVAGNYLGVVFFYASTSLMPVIVTREAGASANAYFYIPWMIAGALQLMAVNMTTSLLVEATIDRTNLSFYCYRVFVHTVRMLGAAAIGILLGAPYILRVFGLQYAAEGALLLRLLALAALPNIVVLLYITIARIQNRSLGVFVVHGSVCVLGLSLSSMLLKSMGISGVGIAWLATQTIVAGFLMLTQLRSILIQGSLASRPNRSEELATE